MPNDNQSRKRLANAQRANLVKTLGGCCAECGSTDHLEIDHPYGRDWVPRRLTHYARIRRYIREAQEGLVRLLCKDCNLSPECRPKPRGSTPPATLCPF